MANQGGNHEQHVKAGQQSHKNDDKSRDMDNRRGQQQAEGGSESQQGGGQRGGSGNFANDPQRASEEGRKGGKS